MLKECCLALLGPLLWNNFSPAIFRRLFTKVMLTSYPELGSLDKLCRCRQSIFFAPRGCVGQLRGRFSFSKENTKGKRSTWQSPWLSDADAAIIHILGTLFLKPLRSLVPYKEGGWTSKQSLQRWRHYTITHSKSRPIPSRPIPSHPIITFNEK